MGFPGARYVGNDLLEIHRCIGHLHIAALGMWLYDDLSNELICHSDVEYGDDPKADKGFLRSISVTNYDPPLEILADRKVRLVTHYDAEILHTGVMGLLFLLIAEKKNLVGMEESMMNAELCIAPECDVTAVLPNGGCRDSLEDSILCTFGGICQCDALLALKETVGGCQGTYISTFGNITVGSVCAEHCGCGEDLLEDSIVEQIVHGTLLMFMPVLNLGLKERMGLVILLWLSLHVWGSRWHWMGLKLVVQHCIDLVHLQ